MLRVAIWVESFKCACILVLQWQGENFPQRQHLKLCYFQPVHCASKNPISPWYSTDFWNLCLNSKMLRVGICVESFKRACILLLQWQGENLAHRQHLKFCHFQPVPRASRNAISPKIFNQFSKSLRQLEDVERGHLGGKFLVRRYITFAMTRWNFAHRHHLKSCYFQKYTVPAKILYLQRHSNDFRNLSNSSKMLKVGIWVESFRCAGILLLPWQGEILRIDTIWSFATFNLYTVPAKILYLQRYSTDFWNVCLNSKMMRVGICLESFRCAGILLLQWKGENMAHRQHLKFCLFQPVHCASKSLMLQRYSADFPNLCLSSRMLRVGIWVGSFSCASILLLQSHLKLSKQMPTLIIFELRQTFQKSVEYLWRYRIFAGTVYRLKVAKLQMVSMRKISPCHGKSNIPAHLKLSTQMPTFNIFELLERFRKSFECLWRYRIFAGTVYFWK